MQFKLRSLLILMVVVAIPLAGYVWLHRNWIRPAQVGLNALGRANSLVARRHWSGSIAPTHYLQRVDIYLDNVDDTGIKELYPILRDIDWLRYIQVYAPLLTEDGLTDLRNEFPHCIVTRVPAQI
jgi:hypothetical protein